MKLNEIKVSGSMPAKKKAFCNPMLAAFPKLTIILW
jgi:hypothetical protein